MNKTIFFVMIVFLVMISVVAGHLGLPMSKQEEDAEYLRLLSKQIRADEKELRAYSKKIITGEEAKNADSATDSTNLLRQTDIWQRVNTVTKDENGNVYFVLNDSFVTFTVGFVLRNRSTELLGDSLEPTITFKEKLFGDWWYYKAH